MRRIVQSKKLQHVRYDVRGPILVEAQRLEAEGHKILKLNIGNTAPFGFEAPEAIVADMIHNLPESQGYADSRGIYSARTAVAQYYQSHGLTDTNVDDVYIGNGVSELITMVLQAFVDDGNEVLVPGARLPPVDRRGLAVRGHSRPLPVRRGRRLEPRPRGRRGQDHGEHARARHHQPEQPDRRRLLGGDGPGPRRHRATARPRRHGRRDLREDPLRRRRPPPRRDVRRRRRPVPHVQRAVQGLPRVRLPRRLGHGVGAEAPRRGLPRGPDPARQHADVRERPRAARDPDRARRLPVDHRAHRPGRPVPRAEQARRHACSTRSPGSRASSRAAPSTASRDWTPRSTRSRATRRSSSTSCGPRRSS